MYVHVSVCLCVYLYYNFKVNSSTFMCQPSLFRFVISVPSATSPSITFHTSHPHPSDLLRIQQQAEVLHHTLSSRNHLLHTSVTERCFQFPETRLIQYDCGK